MCKSLWCAALLVASVSCAEDRGRPRDDGGLGSFGSVGDDGVTDAGESDSAADGSDDASGDEQSSAPADGDATEGELGDVAVAGVSFGRIEASQGVAVQVGEPAGEVPPASRNAELIRGRTTLLSAEWSIGGGHEPRVVEARLELSYPDGRLETLSDEKMIASAADLSDPGGAFSWELGPELVESGMRYRIALFETDGVARDGSVAGSVFPAGATADVTADLGLRSEAMTMTIVLIPVNTPEGAVSLGPDEIAVIEQRLMATYPLQSIDLQVRPPWVRNARLSSLDEAFNYMSSARAQDGEGSGPYYHLILDNSTCCTGADYESWAGIANLVDDSPYAQPREGITKLYPEYGDFEWDTITIIHEVGHNHGRDHAPCGDPGGPDPAFPYPGATLGVRGYDIAEKLIIDPVAIDPTYGSPYTDFMSYCGPNWWSDYSWRALVDRVRTVSSLPSQAPDGERWKLRGFARPNGDVTWSWVRSFATADLRAGQGSLTLRGSAGEPLTEVPVRVSALADSDVEVLEADVPGVSEFAELDLRLDDGRSSRVKAQDVLAAP